MRRALTPRPASHQAPAIAAPGIGREPHTGLPGRMRLAR
jgi:hypothetical protein